MVKLSQIIAVVAGKKARMSSLTEAHRAWKQDLMYGFAKTYEPKDDEGDRLPPEAKLPQLDVGGTVKNMTGALVDFWDVVATQETGNTKAVGRILVDGELLLADVPVGVLLFLEKQLVDIHTFVKGLPTLPPDREWSFDCNRGYYTTEPTETLRTQKVPEPIVKYDATPEHPAQTELHMADKVVGTWTTQYFSTAMPADEKKDILARVEALQDAVKSARAEANSTEVEVAKIGKTILDHIFPS